MKSFEKVMLMLAVILMVVIFMFSAQPDVKSQETSSEVSYKIICVVNYLTGNDWDEEQKQQYALSIDYPVRKIAHMSEYACLTLLFFGSMAYHSGRKKFYLPLIGTFVYACTDEFHQLFVPGRAGKFQDVLIDTAGGAIMLTLIVCVAVFRHRKYNVYN